jgi:hypothetical protein
MVVEVSKKMKKLDLVNRLVEKSFGKKCMGNASVFVDLDYGNSITALDVPHRIVRKGIFSHRHYGNFLNEDGDALEVTPEHLESAKKYARLYETETGEEVKINVISPTEIIGWDGCM